jgi:hypothetical protein
MLFDMEGNMKLDASEGSRREGTFSLICRCSHHVGAATAPCTGCCVFSVELPGLRGRHTMAIDLLIDPQLHTLI